jgi:hypothetical protein
MFRNKIVKSILLPLSPREIMIRIPDGELDDSTKII